VEKCRELCLAVKAILAKYSKLPTLIFDEIDTGFGEIALEWGEIMKEMSLKCKITHLPQIAAEMRAFQSI
jgi:DNA repair protein RecN (Recombination protein N)